MRRGPAALAVLTILFLLGTGFAGPARAGGLTTIVLVVPGEGRTASLSMDTADYQRLATLVGADDPERGSTTPPPGIDGSQPDGNVESSGPSVTLSWLSHDVLVWRLDRVFLDEQGGPWISTQTNTGGADPWAKPTRWRNVAANGKELISLLNQLGVGPAGAGSSDAASVQQPATVAASAGAAEPTDSGAGSPGPGGWLWGPLGLLLGLLLGVGLTLSAVQRRTAPGLDGVTNETADDVTNETADDVTNETADDVTCETSLGLPATSEHRRPRTETLSSHPGG